jgi:hypothetical protein
LTARGWHEFCPLLRIESAAKFLEQDVMPGCLQQDRRDLAEARFVDTSVQDGSADDPACAGPTHQG